MHKAARRLSRIALAATLLAGVATARAQVSPKEIVNPELKSREATYLPQLEVYNHAIQALQFPFPFYLTRYVNLDPQKQAVTDTRGLEFVKFHDRIVLKITGVYGAAYNSARMTPNQRADNVFQNVVTPILQLLSENIPADVNCDAIGFEISYHVQSRTKNYDYEGRENLVVVLERDDAFGFFASPRESARQEILNRSDIYLNGKELGLALGEKDAISVAALDRTAIHGSNPVNRLPAAKPDSESRSPRTGGSVPPTATPRSDRVVPGPDQDVPPRIHLPNDNVTAPAQSTLPAGSPPPVAPKPPLAAPATQVDADRIQAKYQPQLDALAKEGAAQFHLVDYAPPSLVVFHRMVYLQLTMRNPNGFDKDKTSIYKRAAQSFDLFLAPQLKALADKIPADSEIAGLDITVLNELASKPKPASEALEFICPLIPLRRFTDAEITNQELINQSTVLVNGVRIALDLQRVE
jgi:hypothetical protein